MIIQRLIIFLFVLGVNLLSAQSDLTKKIDKIFSNSSFDYASVGMSVRSLDGKEILNIDANKKYIPASSLKLITTFLSLQEFGEDFRFNTRIGYFGTIDQAGTLNGNLVIIGTGDPTFASERFGENYSLNVVLEKIISELQNKGIKCIDGKIEIKTNVFEGQAICPSWPYSDIANYYGSGAWGLNFNENKYDLIFSAAVPQGAIAKLDGIDPEIPNMYIQSEVEVKGPKTGDNAYIYGDPFNYSKIVRGSIPYSNQPFVIKGAVPNPPLSFGYFLEHELSKKGIRTNGSSVSKTPIKRSDFIQLLSIKSPTLAQIVKEANFESINLYCEALLRLMGRKYNKEGSFESGIEFVSETLKQKGLSKSSFIIKDGGGLSPRNGIAPSAFTEFLSVQHQKYGLENYKKYIPHVGVSGTVKSLMKGKKGQKKFFLKSGSMGGVLSYTGVFEAKSGESYLVCFMSNNHSKGNRSVRVQAEKVFELLYSNL